jgi:DNA end-binding protein Ku
MVARSSWKGFVRLSLVSIPVQGINAAARGDGEIHFNQLHAECHNRIKYQKVCPVHGVVPNDEIVMGYEHSKGEYVVVDSGEIDKLRTAAESAITIDTFVSPQAIDPRYFEGRTYFLVPDGPMGAKPYAVFLQALEAEKRWAVGEAVLFGREQLVALRPLDDVLTLEILHYGSQLKTPAEVAPGGSRETVSKSELALAKKLIEASTSKKFDINQYVDDYEDKLKQMIEAKIEGREIVGPQTEEQAPVINLMDALRKSVAQVGSRSKRRGASRSAGTARPATRHRGGRRKSAG